MSSSSRANILGSPDDVVEEVIPLVTPSSFPLSTTDKDIVNDGGVHHNPQFQVAIDYARGDGTSLKEQDLGSMSTTKRKSCNRCKWVYKAKDDNQFKARLVAKGFTQRKGMEYDDIFSPMVRHTSIRVLLAIVAMDDLELEQLDVKTAFLHGGLEETIYMKQPEGFISEGKPDYVYDMLIACKDTSEIKWLKDKLKSEFEMKDLGPAQKVLGREIVRDRKSSTLRLTQQDYIQKILNPFNFDGAKTSSTLLSKHIRITSDDCPKNDKGKA
ncbi:hypothetical protein L6452_19947 [Arctium lappa]|uniref:Uncharacterized protein n=1 Tax=Arctium lappa TaxID=4217 RepID=A0ACB9B9H1_ARCLA|nr:hypothetical protein L6452_19947 [Arctium lappa]